jgi:hypothetical protein
MPQTVFDVPQAGHCFIASLFVPLDFLKPRDGMVRTPRPALNQFGQAGGLAYTGRATLALRARPKAQLRVEGLVLGVFKACSQPVVGESRRRD